MAKTKTKTEAGTAERAERTRVTDRYRGALPFEVHHKDELPVSLETGFRPDDPEFYWDQDIGEIAEAILERGSVLSVRVVPDEVAEVTARVCRNLCRNVWVRYDKAAYRLILWDREPHEVSGKSVGAKEGK